MADEFKSNSYKSREEEETVEKKEEPKRVDGPIVQAKTRKRNGVQKFFRSLIAEDLPNIKDYIIDDILRPTIQNFLIDSLTDTVSMVFGGEVGSRGSRRRSHSDRVSYRDYYDDDRRGSRRRRDRDRDDDFRGYDLDDVIVDTRAEAERVLDKLDEIIDRYGYVTVADVYELVGIQGRWTDNKYGWTRIASAKPQRVRDGYLIQLPRPKPLD